MDGETILARSLSLASTADSHGNSWQYHSQSDRHSKVACWALLFDLLQNCVLMRRHATEGRIAFGINHRMVSARTNEPKNLDLVICSPRAVGTNRPERRTFAGEIEQYRIELTPTERLKLDELPIVLHRPAADVLVAVEAKACMTKHVGSIRRLRGEFADTLEAIHGTSQTAIAVAYAVVNGASSFVSPPSNRRPEVFPVGPLTRITRHNQPRAAQRVQDAIGSLPFRQTPNEQGYDVIGITTIDLRNDMSGVSIATGPVALSAEHARGYEAMVRRICSLYAARFAYI